MSGRFPIMRSLDPHHQRIGYLGSLSMIAYRGLDTKDSVRARLEALLFQKVRSESSEYAAMLQDVPLDRLDRLAAVRKKRKEGDNPASILYKKDEVSDWFYASEIWLYQSCMPSPLGFVPRNRIDRILDLARWTGVLTPTVELSEAGFLLQLLISAPRNQHSRQELFNPLNPQPRSGVPLVYLRLLLGAEMLWPCLVAELVKRSDSKQPLATYGENGILRAGVARLLSCIGPASDPSDILDLRDVTDFHNAIMAKPSTEENYLRPRLEILIDLGLVGRDNDSEGRKDAFPWVPTTRTRKLAEEWALLADGGNRIPDYLEDQYFGSMARVYEADTRVVRDYRHVLLWFARAFQQAGRDIGFTPGRTLALLACVLSFEAGEILEISQVFDAVYKAAKSEWDKYLRFSGGSRFDREFQIKILPGLQESLEQSMKNTPEVQ